MTTYIQRFGSLLMLLSNLNRIHPMIQGVILAVGSNVLFGVLYSYGKWLEPLSGTQVFYWRMVMMWLCLAIFLTLSGQMRQVVNELKSLGNLKNWLYFILPTPILASQLWLFMWAPVNGQSVQVAMGYFLFPLTMVLAGCLIFREKLTKLQKLAVVFAAAGVLIEMLRTSGISWATLWVCGTYPIYYVMRRRQPVSTLTGLFFDVTMIAPACAIMLYLMNPLAVSEPPFLWLKVIGLGAISVLAIFSNVEASRLLPVSLFGMLGYLEPVLLFLLSITVLGGVFDVKMLAGYGLIWLAVICLIVQGVLMHKKRQRKS